MQSISKCTLISYKFSIFYNNVRTILWHWNDAQKRILAKNLWFCGKVFHHARDQSYAVLTHTCVVYVNAVGHVQEKKILLLNIYNIVPCVKHSEYIFTRNFKFVKTVLSLRVYLAFYLDHHCTDDSCNSTNYAYIHCKIKITNY